MKLIRATFLVALLTALPIFSFAITRKSVTINDPVTVGHTVLQPGQYQVEWSGNGTTNVPVQFKKNDKTVASATATIQQQHNTYEALEVKNGTGGAKVGVLQKIQFKNESLIFQQGAGTSGNGL
jgi:hypothetical protein